VNIRPLLAAAALATLTPLAGCGLKTPAPDHAAVEAGQVAEPTPTPGVTPSAATGLGDSVKDAGDIPDPCTLLSNAEVTSLTGRDITLLDRDDAAAGDPVRYCQWQQTDGQLAVFLARTTADEFAIKIADATPVDGIGEDAFALAGHLYVLYGTVSVDVYTRGDSDAANLATAKRIAGVLLTKI
jgi:hypothetical protein